MDRFTFKKGLGQNFLESRKLAADIVSAAAPTRDDFVIEIGPGAGAITFGLAEGAGHLVAIELDPRLVQSLREQFAGDDHVKIVFDDIMLTDLDEILEHEHAENFKTIKFVGNIPYNITTPIITKLLESGIPYDRIVLMIQDEVAQRISSPPGHRAYGYMSVLVQYYTEAEYLFKVGRENFLPAPNVDSAVVRLMRRQEPPVQCEKEKFFDVVKQCFSKKRKTLANNLAGYAGLDKTSASQLLEGIGIDPKRRAETLSLEEFDKIALAVGTADTYTIQTEKKGPLSKW